MANDIVNLAFQIGDELADVIGVSVVDAEFKKEAGKQYLRIFIDKDGGVGIDDCEAFSRAFEKKFDEAKELLDKVFEEQDTLVKKNILEAQEHRIYINIMTMEPEALQKYYDEDVPLSLKREISQDASMTGIRTYLLMAGLLDKARGECLIALNKLTKAYRNTPRNRQHSELVLFNEALEKVCQAHPKWELEVYKLYE